MLTGLLLPARLSLCQGAPTCPKSQVPRVATWFGSGAARCSPLLDQHVVPRDVGAAAADDGPDSLGAEQREAVRLDHVTRRDVVDRRTGRDPAYTEVLERIVDDPGHGPGRHPTAAGVGVRPVPDLALDLRHESEEADRCLREIVGRVDDGPDHARPDGAVLPLMLQLGA